MCCALSHLLISQSGRCKSISSIDCGSHALTANTVAVLKKVVSARAIAFCVSLFILQNNAKPRRGTMEKGRESLDYLWYPGYWPPWSTGLSAVALGYWLPNSARKAPGVFPTIFLNTREKYV